MFGAATFSASDTGRLSYSLFEPYQYQFAWFDRSGTALGNVGEQGIFNSFDLSADGKRVIVARGKTDTVNLWGWTLKEGDLPKRLSETHSSSIRGGGPTADSRGRQRRAAFAESYKEAATGKSLSQ